MVDKVINILKKNKIDLYRVNYRTVETAELFFIKKSLDTRRIENYSAAEVTVYNRFTKDGRECMGDSVFSVGPYMTEEQIEDGIKKAYMAAGFVPNKPYSLAEGIKRDHVASDSGLAKLPFNEIADRFTEALFVNDTSSEAFINSAELFVKKTTERILNSNGLDVSFDTCSASGEFVVQCKEPVDVENYNSFDYNDMNVDQLAEKVSAALTNVKNRSVAQNNPVNGKTTIVLADENAEKVLSYFREKISGANMYYGYVDEKVGDFVQGSADEVKGDTVSIDLLPSEPYSTEGIELTKREALKDGIIKQVEAGLRFATYLGVPVTGYYSKAGYNCGTYSFEDMKKQKGLYIVTFSDFQMDAILGVFRGEIRLAYYNDGNTITPVTGGSVNGAILEARKNITLSKEKAERTNYSGPKAIMIADVSVCGVQD